MTKIVIGWDGSEGALDALALARDLAEQGAASLLAAHVSSRHGHRGPATAPDGVPLRELTGVSPVIGLGEFVRAEEADLLVVGSDRPTGLGAILTGGVARRLVVSAPCPVAVAPAGYRKHSPGPPKVVAVGFDASEGAAVALELGEAIALANGATMRVVAVDQHWFPREGLQLSHGQAAAHEHIRAALDRAVGALDGRVRAQAKLLGGGNAVHVLLEEAAEGVDLLVTGSRGLGGFWRALLGSVSREVVRSAPCPVIVVPSDAARGPRTGVGKLTEVF